MAAKKTAKTPPVSAPVEPTTPAKPSAKKAAKTVGKETPAAANKAVAKKATPKAMAKPSLDAIARAAYLIYRRRVEQGLPGNSHGDWLEAERQFSEKG